MALTTKLIEVRVGDLDASGGIYCPNPKANMQLWNSHPKVYFDVGHHGHGSCPYCGTEYILAKGEVFAGGH